MDRTIGLKIQYLLHLKELQCYCHCHKQCICRKNSPSLLHYFLSTNNPLESAVKTRRKYSSRMRTAHFIVIPGYPDGIPLPPRYPTPGYPTTQIPYPLDTLLPVTRDRKEPGIRDTLPPPSLSSEQTHACENITSQQLRWWAVKTEELMISVWWISPLKVRRDNSTLYKQIQPHVSQKFKSCFEKM